MYYAAIGLDVLKQIPTFIVGVTVFVTRRVNMTDEALGLISEKPFGSTIGVTDAVGVIQTVVVMGCLMA